MSGLAAAVPRQLAFPVPKKTVLFVCDVQERPRPFIYAFPQLITAAQKMVVLQWRPAVAPPLCHTCPPEGQGSRDTRDPDDRHRAGNGVHSTLVGRSSRLSSVFARTPKVTHMHRKRSGQQDPA